MDIEAVVDTAFAPAAAAVAAERIPGAVLGAVTMAGARAVRVAGLAQRVPAHVALARATWFDLASLTKVIVTTTALLELVDAGRIALDDPLVRAIPDLRQYDLKAAERELTFRQCLTHRSFLPAVEPLYTYGQDARTLRAFVLQRVWTRGPAVYSDINFILLGIAVERLTGRDFGAQPLAAGLAFRPDPAQCAATEACTWRGRVLRGEVHDENAFALGGAAGHAGLFGTIDGVLDFARDLLTGSRLSAAGRAALRAPQSPTRTLGWERRHPDWAGGQACSEETIGHTGFTGTGLWIDWTRGLAWALLTNRVHPSRHVDTGIQTLRRETGERLIEAFDRAN
ncbi:MAG: serine hydrolase [Alphaproteobacteria bacterium]|nr:serine hydrolase [Alphaproteobacteria bacterium]